jgi:hypothetical protein
MPIDPAAIPLQTGTVGDDLGASISSTIGEIIAFLPRLIGALLILLIGWIVGRLVAGLVSKAADAVELDRMVLDTPLGQILGGTERAVAHAFGTLAKWFVYAIAILAAADVLAIALLSEWIARAVSYLPAFIAGLVVIVVGFVVADFVADAIRRTREATESKLTQWFAQGTRLFLYFIVLTIGLDTMGIDVGILFVFARAVAWGLAIALALGAGIAFGWGGKDYVNDNIGRWMGKAKSARSQGSGTSDDTRSQPDD